MILSPSGVLAAQKSCIHASSSDFVRVDALVGGGGFHRISKHCGSYYVERVFEIPGWIILRVFTQYFSNLAYEL